MSDYRTGLRFGPISDVQGFSMRDGLTHLEIQEHMRRKLLELIAGQANTNNYMRTVFGADSVLRDDMIAALAGVTDIAGTISPRLSVYVARYLTPGATPAENVTAINTALAFAVTNDLDACFDGVDCSIDDDININTAGTRLWAATPVACHITQTVKSRGVFYVWANNVTIEGMTLTGPLADVGDTLDFGGIADDPHLTTAIKMDCGIDGLTINRIVASNWFTAVAGFPYPFTATLTDPELYKFITNIRVSDLRVSSVWTGVRMSGVKGADFSRVQGSFKPVSNHSWATTSPSHLFYVSNGTITTEVPKAWNENVRVSDCYAENGTGGCAFSLRYTNGLTLAKLTANNCEGLLDMIGVHGFTVADLHSTNDKFPKDNAANGNRGSVAALYCSDGTFNPFVIEGKAGIAHGSVFYLGYCTDVSVNEPRGWVNLPAEDVTFVGMQLSGNRVTVTKPSFENRGTAKGSIGYDIGAQSDVANVTLNSPVSKGLMDFGIRVWPTATKQSLIYSPGKLEALIQKVVFASAVTEAGSPILNNQAMGGYPPDSDARVVGWHTGEALDNSHAVKDRWPSGQISTVVTDAWISNPPYLNANAIATGVLCANFGTANVEVETDVKLGAGATQMGIVLRAIDVSNFLHVVIDATNVKLEKRIAGVTSQLATAALANPGGNVWRNLRASAVGNVVRVMVDGAQVIAFTLTGGDEVTFGAATSHGLRSLNGVGGSAWYRTKVRAL